jgi:molybdopterin biosynthesis enzyme
VLRVNVEALSRINRVDPLEVFSLFHGQAVRAGQPVASAKVAPHLVPGAAVAAGVAVAQAAAPVVDVVPYLPLEVAAIAAEPLASGALERFDAAARAKVTALGGRFSGTTLVPEEDATAAAAHLTTLLTQLVARPVALVLVGGVSAGDPLSPMFEALEALGGTLLRRGVPAHPGSMIWLARLGETTLLGLPQCGMFSMATAADLVLPRLLTGEQVTADTLADLGHGGMLGREMRFRFPDYARDLEAPE